MILRRLIKTTKDVSSYHNTLHTPLIRYQMRTAIIMSGKELSQDILLRVKEGVKFIESETGKLPKLAIISSGDDAASESYIRQKKLRAKEVNIEVEQIRLDLSENNITPLAETVKHLAHCPDTTGIIIQLPIFDIHGNILKGAHKSSLDYLREQNLLIKDVDGMHPCSSILCHYTNFQKPFFLTCTPLAVLKLLKQFDINVRNKNAVVIGRSNIVGFPLITTFLQDKYRMTVISPHKSDRNLKRYTEQADLIVSAAGVPSLIQSDMVKDGAILIDIGINRVSSTENTNGYKLVGDIDPASYEKSYAYTPVPGGIGPVTVAVLLENVLRSALIQSSLPLPPIPEF